jgi:hypothetical protein
MTLTKCVGEQANTLSPRTVFLSLLRTAFTTELVLFCYYNCPTETSFYIH